MSRMWQLIEEGNLLRLKQKCDIPGTRQGAPSTPPRQTFHLPALYTRRFSSHIRPVPHPPHAPPRRGTVVVWFILG
jgi:hypothetical protein